MLPGNLFLFYEKNNKFLGRKRPPTYMGGRFSANSRISFEYTAISLEFCIGHITKHL